MIETVLAVMLAADATAPAAPPAALERVLDALRPTQPSGATPVALVSDGGTGLEAIVRGMRVEAHVAVRGVNAPAPIATATPTATPIPTPAAPSPDLSAHPERSRETRSVQRRLSPDGRLTVAFYAPDGTAEGGPIVRDVTTLPVVSQRRDDEGRIVRVVADPSGAPIEVLLDPMGRFLHATLLDRAATTDAR
jgi:hypothetical protein